MVSRLSAAALLAWFAAAVTAAAAPLAWPAAAPVLAQAAPNDILLSADVDKLVAYARDTPPGGQRSAQASMVIAVDALTAGKPKDARAALNEVPLELRASAGDLFEMWVLLAEGDPQKARWRAEDAQGRLPPGLGALAPALLLEASGQLREAARAYDALAAGAAPPATGPPTTAADLARSFEAPRTAQILFRAAQVHHRLGERKDAERLYRLSGALAPNSPDVAINVERLKGGRPPLDAPLNARTGLGRWLLFLSYDLTLIETLRATLASPIPAARLSAPNGMIYALLGLRLDPDAHDWLVSTAGELASAGGYAGAEKLLARLPQSSVYAPDGELVRARAALRQKDDAVAAAAAAKALALAPSRWALKGEAGALLSLAGRDAAAIAALDAMVRQASGPEDRAAALLARAQAHYQAGRMSAAGGDARAAMAQSQTDSVRATAAAMLALDPATWSEAVRINRELLQAQPDSASRLNGLGYTLIQREESLDEGFKLLRRGVAASPQSFDIVDSLGWAYYLFGDFETARKLVARAHELTGDQPNAEILDHLGDIYWRLDRADDARRAWRDALDARPDGQRRALLAAKIAAGLKAAAPKSRTPPDVDLKPRRSAPAIPI
ncbi:MAG: tetratricopeptide repeat protein [Hyphomonadaceae bacterium]